MLVLIKGRLHPRAPGTQKRWMRELVQPKHKIRGLENSAPASLLVYSDHALQECSLLNIYSNLQTHIIRQARIEVTAAYALNYLKLQVLKLSKLLQDFIYLRQDSRNVTRVALNKFQFLSANMIALIGTVLYNTIKEYHDNRTRKTIHFHSYTVEDNYNAIRKKTGHSNKKDIEANEREEETRVQLRKSSEEIHDILLREFREANDFTESVTHNDDEQELEPEDCDALVERYEEEINCSDLYSTM
ncbi:hypothetical protein HBH49_217820 [Parastagonospora nodorum]|nr:hypothetical protein HBH49_217820 [Parastagonospora nodorum]